MLVAQWNTTPAAKGDPFVSVVYPYSVSDQLSASLVKDSSPPSQPAPPSESPEDGGSGFYSTDDIYVIGGRLNSPAGYITSQFVLYANYFVDGTPPSSNPDSTLGRFPVNGQYPSASGYRLEKRTPASDTGVTDQQFAISKSDPVAAQFAYNPVLAVEGAPPSSLPALITGYQFRSGQYLLQISTPKDLIPDLTPVELQTSQARGTLGGQILVNGQNIFLGNFNSSTAQSYPVNQQGTLILQGQYDSQGFYQVNGQALQNGENFVSGYFASNGNLTPVQINLIGAYSSGGQYVLYNTAPPQPLPSSFSEINAISRPPVFSPAPTDQMASYLVTIASLINHTINRSYGPTMSDEVLLGQYLNLLA